MNCGDVRIQLPDYVREIISGESRVELSEHLAGCEQCRAEEHALAELVTTMRTETAWQPSYGYWSTLLPGIHERIDRKSFIRLPVGIIRFAAPLAAAIILIVGLIQFRATNANDELVNASSTLEQLGPEELQAYAEQQSVIGLGDQPDSTDQMTTAEDKSMLKDILLTDSPILASAITDDDVSESLSDQDIDELIPVLERRIHSHD